MIALSALSIRNLDDRVKERLRVRAARHGRSMEAEVRANLTDAVAEPGEAPGLFRAIMDRFAATRITMICDDGRDQSRTQSRCHHSALVGGEFGA